MAGILKKHMSREQLAELSRFSESVGSTTKQVHKNKLNPPNPEGAGGFGEHPEHRSPGGWKSENTISFQYRRFMNMDRDEFVAFAKVPNSQKTMAMLVAYNRVAASMKSLPDAKEIADRTEGKAPQAVDITSNGETIAPVLVKFMDNDE